ALIPYYNPEALAAVQNMLGENFSKIYDEDVNQLVLPKMPQAVEAMKPSTMKSILSGNIPKLEEILTPSFECEVATDLKPKLANYLAQANAELFSEIAKSMMMFSKFYISNDHILANLFTPLISSILFENIKDFEEFLTKHVDFSNINNFENSFIQIQTMPNEIHPIPIEAKKIWSKIIAHGGKQAMIKFSSNQKFSIEAAYEELGGNIADLWEKILKDSASDKPMYDNLTKETEALAQICTEYNITQGVFDRIATEILPSVKDHDDLPNMNFDIEFKGQTFHFSKLPAGDLRGLFLGHDTGCCQSIGGDAEKAVKDAFTRTDAGFYVLTDANGKIKAQSLAWLGEREIKSEAATTTEKVLVLDSFEHNKDIASIYIPLMKEILKHIGALELHIGVGGQTPSTYANVCNDIKAPEDFNRYGDSSYAYHITDSVKLSEKYKWDSKQYNSFEEYVNDHAPNAFNELYHEKYQAAKNLNIHSEVARDAKALKLLSSSKILSDFVSINMRYDEVEYAPLESNFFHKELANVWFITMSNGVRYTHFHKFKILETLLEQGYDKAGIAKIFNDYYSYYNFDPALLEKIGYENITRLPYATSGCVSLSTIKNMIMNLKTKDEAEAKAGLEKILADLASPNRDEVLKVLVQESALKQIEFPEYINEKKQKALMDGFCKKFPNLDPMILQHAVQNIPESLWKELSAEELLNFFRGEYGGYCTYVNDITRKIPAELLVEFVRELMAQDLTEQISIMCGDLSVPLKYMSVKEVVETWNGSYFVTPNYIYQIERNESPYIKSLDNEGLRKLATLMKSMNSDFVSWVVLEMLDKYDVQTINELGIENIVHFFNGNYFGMASCDDIEKLKLELNDAEMPEEFTATSGEHYHKIHLARHLTIPAGASFETDFPIMGFYKEAQNVGYSNCFHSNASGESYCTYRVTNTGENPIVLDHI
ncbi:MAG: hypothetical protein RLZZ59_372, partial [Pseudomonadota bacterium]